MKIHNWSYKVDPGEVSLFIRLMRIPVEASGHMYFTAQEGERYTFSVVESGEFLDVELFDGNNTSQAKATFQKEVMKTQGGGYFPIVIPM